MNRNNKKVMCFGTFDSLHPGHESFLKQAGQQGDFLIVVVARDKTVRKIKGKNSIWGEKRRKEEIEKLDFVDKAALGKIKDKYSLIRKFKPDIICLGYDQVVDITELKKHFTGNIIRLKAFKPKQYKSSIINNKNNNFSAKRIKGEGKGTKLGFPTINLDKTDLDLPFGVYLVEARIGKNKYQSLMHFGPKATFNKIISTELFIKDKVEVDGRIIRVEIIEKIRDIKKFKNKKELIRAIKGDVGRIS